MTVPNLLAYKPVLLNLSTNLLHPASTPEFAFAYKTPVITTCSRGHSGMEIPEERCACGVYTTIDIEEIQKFINTPVEVPKREYPMAPFMAVVQVLGKTVVEDMTLRSWGIFLWGIVRPASMPQDTWSRVIDRLNRKYATKLGWYGLIMYNDLESSLADASPTWVSYDIYK